MSLLRIAGLLAFLSAPEGQGGVRLLASFLVATCCCFFFGVLFTSSPFSQALLTNNGTNQFVSLKSGEMYQ